MLIITDSENLLERFRMSLNINDDKSIIDSEKNIANAAIINYKKNHFVLREADDGYIILVGKDIPEESQKLIIECIHQIIVQNGKIKLFVVKTEIKDNDSAILKNLINQTKESWHSLWNSQLEKTLDLSESISRTERKTKLEKWLHLPNVDIALTSFDDLNLSQRICSFFNVNPIKFINQIYCGNRRDSDLSNDDLHETYKNDNNINLVHELSTKPPALNWTPFPRYSEVQISLKYKILKGCLTEDMFRFLISSSGKSYNWEYKYEWVNGILLREDVIKVTITRNDTDDDKFLFLEIAGRVDKDELDEDCLVPMKAIWPNLARVIKSTFCFFEKHDTIPYIMNLLLIGDIFFENDDKNFRIEARSVDMVQSFTSIERLGKVAFRAHDRTWLLNLSQVFPDIHPICDADLWKTRLMTFSTDNDKKDTKQKCNLNNQMLSLNEELKSANELSSHQQPSSLLSVHPHKSRGRKVSFGGISSFPISSFVNKTSNHENVEKNVLEKDTNLMEKTNIENNLLNNKNNEQHPVIENEINNAHSINDFIDNILTNVMEDVLHEKINI
uniref:Tudor domain-containing protein n=1 Tax=Parastrongyloides trichosuri TaxID=131310 RepID=A0A0N4ZHL9_PARTI